jgi:uncharacterized coiled-coil protein SlyX
MTWQTASLTWPTDSLQASAESVTNQVGSAMNTATGKLAAVSGDASFARNTLSASAVALLGLRSDLELLLNQGTVLSASLYQYQVGSELESGAYLNPQTAVKVLAAKLRDLSDANRPTGSLHAVAVMLTDSTLTSFATKLSELVTVLSLPEWCQVARQATAMSTNDIDKLHQPAAIVQPRFKPTAHITSTTLSDYLTLQGAQIATLESLASDSTNVIDKLSVLAAKRTQKLSQLSAQINALKQLSGNVYSFSLSGTPESIASQLTQATVPNSHQFTLASVLLSAAPLPFFEGLLCSH